MDSWNAAGAVCRTIERAAPKPPPTLEIFPSYRGMRAAKRYALNNQDALSETATGRFTLHITPTEKLHQDGTSRLP